MKNTELQDAVVLGLSKDIGSEWDSLSVHYENYSHNGAKMEIYVSSFLTKGLKNDFELSLESCDLLIELQSNMQDSTGSTWSFIDLIAESSGKYNFEYGYGMPPLAREQLERAGELGNT